MVKYYFALILIQIKFKDYGGWSIEVSAVLMVHTIKATSFAWCYADGNKPDEKLSTGILLNPK